MDIVPLELALLLLETTLIYAHIKMIKAIFAIKPIFKAFKPTQIINYPLQTLLSLSPFS